MQKLGLKDNVLNFGASYLYLEMKLKTYKAGKTLGYKGQKGEKYIANSCKHSLSLTTTPNLTNDTILMGELSKM